MSEPHILYVGPFGQTTGYAQAAHDYLMALKRTGVSLSIMPIVPFNEDDLEERYEELLPLLKSSSKRPTHIVLHTVPAVAAEVFTHFFHPTSPLSDARRILITTWETVPFPQEIMNSVELVFDRVIVPSEFCSALFYGSGIPVAVVSHCYDPNHWAYEETEERQEGPFVFYSILNWSERKNPVGLLKAYFGAFHRADNVLLRLKLSSVSMEDIAALVNALGYSADQIPEFEIVTDYMDHEDLKQFHLDGDCYVSASRGEGFNLPAFEARILGRSMIVTPGGETDFVSDHAANPDYLSDKSHVVHIQWTPAISPPVHLAGDTTDILGVRVKTVKQIAPSGITARQCWMEPDLCMLGDRMRQVLNTQRGKKCRFSPLPRFEYATVGPELLKTILEA